MRKELQAVSKLIETRIRTLECMRARVILEARAHAGVNRRAALFAMKKKRLIEDHIQRASALSLVVVAQELAVEEAILHEQGNRVLQLSTNVLRQTYARVNIHETLDQMEKMRDEISEIDGAFQRAADAGVDVNDLEQELAHLLVADMPEVPTLLPEAAQPTAPKRSQEDVYRDLEVLK